MVETESEYCRRRANEEARLAAQAETPEAAAAHQGMAIRYSARALILSIEDESVPRSAFPQF